ncbi:short-chain dehydrogenase [Dulcicalothrix desertica PCC 7102]|uniref:Short-chain dehydrogenase n=1 Tax=Dulcicalothrix desertica PCC 7102 TaxID=232991 RepID=A0A3S1A8M5_9CYAN|nr:SDR family oxidoreductase [Dulcicalothrix desertica]RUS95904.1 short-chain dehydrogenase [Dulcicalothrix desertica PCC 7102]TWH39538.1 NADP-dependent 3-hydroxy acid dehydrogenase YdfG [Dulcicalothrix desertica PCC 7102]
MNQIVFITGASSGIGAACTKVFAQNGAKLILAARRYEKLQQVVELLSIDSSNVHLIELDVRNRAAVESAISSLPAEWSDIDILINNAGLSRGLDKLHEGAFEDWEEMIDTNIKGLLYMTRYIVPGMVQRARGHVINIGSIAGHQTYPSGNVYCGTKAAVKSISEGLKQDLLGTPVRVTSVDPGMVETEFSEVRFHGDTERAAKVYQGVTPLTPDDVADVIYYCATRPAHVNINEVILMPVDQASATLVNRK